MSNVIEIPKAKKYEVCVKDFANDQRISNIEMTIEAHGFYFDKETKCKVLYTLRLTTEKEQEKEKEYYRDRIRGVGGSQWRGVPHRPVSTTQRTIVASFLNEEVVYIKEVKDAI